MVYTSEEKLVQKLKDWRSRKANLDGVERYVILHNKTIEMIAEALPKNKEEFQAIKGLGGKKYEKYGQEILKIVNGTNANTEDSGSGEGIISVSNFLNLVNSQLSDIRARVKGEISSVDFRDRYLFFTLKDPEDESALPCFMWSRDYELCGIELEEGLEVIVDGQPKIYRLQGRFSFYTDTIELVGEGVLKKAYDKLKKKLFAEGIFDESRKRATPVLPVKIGLVTSKTGAVIHDFENNIGRFGYQIKLYDSRVEGMYAVKELIEAIKYFKDKDIDVLVVIRGGGSLESLQAFNNEALIREIVAHPVPIICGIGHEKDVPLFAMVADKAFSTPTAVARDLNRTWEELVQRLDRNEERILERFSSWRNKTNSLIDIHNHRLSRNFEIIVARIEVADRIVGIAVQKLSSSIRNVTQNISFTRQKLIGNFTSNLTRCAQDIKNIFRLIMKNDPNRQLRLGYSIAISNGRVVKSVNQVEKNNKLINKVSDGEIISSVAEIKS